MGIKLGKENIMIDLKFLRENPEVVKEEEFKDYSRTPHGITVKLPACSVVSIRIKK